MSTVTALGNADAQILTTGTDVLAPTTETWLIMKATVNNQDAAAQTVTVYRVPSGGTAGTDNIVIYALSIPAGETYALPLSGQTITENQVLHLTTSVTAKMNFNASYAIVTA